MVCTPIDYSEPDDQALESSDDEASKGSDSEPKEEE
jgi:hypothetical protein